MPTANAALVDRENLRAGIDAALARHVAALRGTALAISPDASPLADAVERMLAGGKRLRAAFCYWSWRAHGGVPGDDREVAVLRAGAALELFQAAALFHDDVMDDSSTRRGLPTAHRVFADEHVAAGRRGGSRRFGDGVAILLGDLALIASDEEMSRALAGLPEPVARGARSVYELMRTEVTIGQYLDLVAQTMPWDDPAEDERRAREVVRTKAARYSVEHPIVLGAALAGADEDALAGCRAVGLPLGEAFQLRDDLLGVLGDPSTTGKPTGDDLREGKRTVLVARALARATETGDTDAVATLTGRVGDADLDADGVAELTALLVRTGAVAEVEELIEELREQAFAQIEAQGWPEPARSALVALARAAVDRTA
ncbi:polyprenyl synthetase family protein [Cellulomonas sp. zg-ZUI222]|uniref:Polyprenyl synthetase family protein n=1 Tax=Cellulomonas wangleii TaxID=2816956 RepID=A0ABX8D1R0_9CELL|nr:MULTISPECIES: polyprenyl synthetase family protein [Cellulomonas]MBO0900127.1 polyprenyl synthetase family protein [Cellulomonas sp. zg-ZUI22]MBO0920958.1 polyprenyl synthetase family protein [Cellulomonas wangleii]MBO0925560.1 polyprenyl synthetase family protein [Cellulomonas wangleii]QVI60976.1 polyprenyl synthetase family protein [Cellulomonas wangleii]